MQETQAGLRIGNIVHLTAVRGKLREMNVSD
jgi:hypothetical protein